MSVRHANTESALGTFGLFYNKLAEPSGVPLIRGYLVVVAYEVRIVLP